MSRLGYVSSDELTAHPGRFLTRTPGWVHTDARDVQS
jgi:hypothetical protein